MTKIGLWYHNQILFRLGEVVVYFTPDDPDEAKNIEYERIEFFQADEKKIYFEHDGEKPEEITGSDLYIVYWPDEFEYDEGD